MITKIIFALIFLLMDYIAGSAAWVFVRKTTPIKDAYTRRIFLGFNVVVTLSVMICFIASLLSLSVAVTFAVVLISLTIVVVIAFVLSRKNHESLFIVQKDQSLVMNRFEMIVLVLDAVLVLLQIAVVIKYAYTQVEAVRMIPVATRVYDTAVCSGASPIMIFWGMIAGLTGIHPLVLIYSVMPAVMITCYYLGYYSLMQAVSKENRLISLISVAVISMLNIWGYQSERMIPVTILFSWFSGWCFLVHSLAPLIFMILTGYRRKHPISSEDKPKGMENHEESGVKDIGTDTEDEEYEEEWDMKKHRFINARNLAIAIGVIAVAMVGFVFVLNSKINTLHAATANLQRDLNSRCAMYEFTSENGEVKGYLLEGSDGSRTFVGGGSAQDAQALSEFLQNHGTQLTNWYLYGTDDSNKGAYDKCVRDLGISVKNVYVLYTAQMEK